MLVPLTLAGCGGSAGAPHAVATSRAASTPTRSVAASSPAPCSNARVISTWSTARRVAQLIVAPVLNFDSVSVGVAVEASVGGVLFLGSASPPGSLAAELRPLHALGVDGPLVMADEEGGGVQRLAGPVSSVPWPRDMATSMTPAEVRSLAGNMARQMLQLGVTVDLAPVLDVDGRPGPSGSNPDGRRSFSADPAVAARYGTAFLAGLRDGGVLPVVKHFPGLGGSSGNTDDGPASTPPLSELKATGLAPFESAVRDGAPAVMISNAEVPGLTQLPASLSPQVIQGLLRDGMGFSGLVVTDSLSAGAITQAGLSLAGASVAAVAAGADMVLFGSTLTSSETNLLSPAHVQGSIAAIETAFVEALRSGRLTQSRLNDAVLHILAAKGANLCSGGAATPGS